MDEWLDTLVRRVALEIVGAKQSKGTLVATDYNPMTHAVKGIIVPHGVESGWIPIAAMHVGNGFGILVGPSVGSADALDGQVFDLHADFGDPNTLVAHHRQFSTPETPPQVQSGEVLLQHANGNQIFFKQDNSLTMLHGKSGANIQFDGDGNITHDAKGQSITIKSTKKISLTGPVDLNG